MTQVLRCIAAIVQTEVIPTAVSQVLRSLANKVRQEEEQQRRQRRRQ